MSGTDFVDAVALRAGTPPADVERILAQHRVVPDPAPPAARRLRMRSIMFTGTKVRPNREPDPFSFAWDTDDDGLWGVATDGNSVGKTSIVQIVLWALRGTRKSLAPDVARWLSRVEAVFLMDDRDVKVAFDVRDGIPTGEVVVADSGPQSFNGDDAFRRVMQDVMLRGLDLEPLVGSKNGKRHEDGWPAYTLAFLSDRDSNAIIGEYFQTDFTQRLLQVYIGLPWATTLFQARAALNEAKAREAESEKRAKFVGGRTLADLRAEFAQIEAQLGTLDLAEENGRGIAAAEKDFSDAVGRVTSMSDRITELRDGLDAAKRFEIRVQRLVEDVKEETQASLFFGRLTPGQCPRCSTPITAERKRRETDEHRCSVCTATVSESEGSDLEAERAEAATQLATATAEVKAIQKAIRDAEVRHAQLQAQRIAAGQVLRSYAALGTEADRLLLTRSRDRLGGILEVAEEFAATEESNSDGIVLAAAVAEALERVEAVSAQIFERVSAEVTDLAKTLGIPNLDRIVISRNATVSVRIGGTKTSFTKLSPGIQLRLRIATVLALVRVGGKSGGRHPGLHFVDAPGAEEMTTDNLGEVLREIRQSAEGVGNFQLFVVVRGIDEARSAIPADRLRLPDAEGRLW